MGMIWRNAGVRALLAAVALATCSFTAEAKIEQIGPSSIYLRVPLNTGRCEDFQKYEVLGERGWVYLLPPYDFDMLAYHSRQGDGSPRDGAEALQRQETRRKGL